MDDGIKLQILFQTLGDANRLKIIKFIGNQRRTVSEIVASTGLSQPLVSHHLRVLREQNILNTKRDGPFIYYELSDARILEALGLFTQILINSKNKTDIKVNMFSCREQLIKAFNKK